MKFTKCFLALGLLMLACAQSHAASTNPYYKIKIIDSETHRGVPLVELETVNHVFYFTDSNGVVAFNEPGLMNQKVFFNIRSHGYEFKKDGFGFAGVTLEPKEGDSIEIPIVRKNIAERLYRITGGGIYRDTVLLGEQPPIKEPVLDGQVFGQDTVMAEKYHGRIYWFFGDTMRPRYPLGQYRTSGAISDLPENEGLNPTQGVNLKYFVDGEGFSKQMCPSTEEGPIWIDGLLTVTDAEKKEHLICHYARVKNLSLVLEHGLMMFNDEKQIFQPLVKFNLNDKVHCPRGHVLTVKDNGKTYFYFASPLPNVRVLADLQHLKDQSAYEAFTCLEPGSIFNRAGPYIERKPGGELVYDWKPNTPPTGTAEERDIMKLNKMTDAEARFNFTDVETGKPIVMHAGSVYWNEYKKKYIMIAAQSSGSTSYLGEIWFAEAASPTGPWRWAKKIITHDRYSFYNPTQHPFFDALSGRIIYFEGTYTADFSGNPVRTPRYEYNQIMYRLDLEDQRLQLPAPDAK